MRTNNLPRNRKGEKLYPVCSWERNQHKLYNANDRLFIAMHEAYDEKRYDEAEELESRLAELDRLVALFNSQIIDGTVYATWEDGKKIKDYIGAYNARH